MADVISIQGITKQNGQMVSWRDFTSMTTAEQNKVMQDAGLTTQEASQLQADLARNQNITWVDKPGPTPTAAEQQQLNQQQGLSPDTPWQPQMQQQWVDPAYAQLAAQVQGESTAAAEKKKLATEAGVPTDPAAAKSNAPTTVNAPISTQALNDYVASVVMPLMKNYQSLVNGDMAQWGGMINQIKAGSAGASTNFATPNLQLLGQLQNMYGQAAMTDQVLSPYLNMVNQTIGQNVKIGMAKEAIGASESLLQQTAATTPMLQQVLQQSGSGSLGTASNILGQIAASNTPATQPLGTGG